MLTTFELMDFVKSYLEKQSYSPTLLDQPHPDLSICLAIPCYDEPDLVRTLQTIWDCKRPQKAVEVMVVLNSSENAPAKSIIQNLTSLSEGIEWAKYHHDQKLRFHFLNKTNLPKKFAGVGLARKIGMDEAVWHFSQVNNPKGIIAGFDADSLCDTNYLIEIERHFLQHLKSDGASIYFEHPISGIEFSDSIYERIIQYELHLRYMNQALRYVSHPHAFHTVGSSFAVRMDAYVKQGGMNKRQAGEDFYFLQKIISLENYTEINSTRVIPSPRESDRVPFGTGAAMRLLQSNEEVELKTYSLKSYIDLKGFFDEIPNLYETNKKIIENYHEGLPYPLKTFLSENQFINQLASIQSNVSSPETFRDRFFRWFNAFKVIKYLNYYHTEKCEKQNVSAEAGNLLSLMEKIPPKGAKDLLEVYRTLDRKGI